MLERNFREIFSCINLIITVVKHDELYIKPKIESVVHNNFRFLFFLLAGLRRRVSLRFIQV